MNYNWEHAACNTQRDIQREKKTLKAGVPYILFYTVLFHPVCVLINSSLLSPPHNLQATATVRVLAVWVSAMSHSYLSHHTFTVPSSLIAFFHSSHVKCRT